MVQRLTLDHLSNIEEVTIEKDQTQMTWSKKRRVMLNEAPISEYHVAKKVSPFLPPISIDSIQKTFCKSSYKTKRSIINLAMSMINMHCESENQRIPPIPSWTGFNIILLLEKYQQEGILGICSWSIVTQLI